MRRPFRPCSSRCLPLLLLLPLTLLPLTPVAAQSMGGNGLDSYGYDSGGTYHGSNYGNSPNYMVTGPSDADMAKMQSQLEHDFGFLDRRNDPPPRRWSDDNDYTPPPPPPPRVPTYMEQMQAKADAGDRDAMRYLAFDIVLWDRGDYGRAVDLYQKAIDAGDKTSMDPLYHLLLDKKRGVVDVARASKMLPALAEQDCRLQDVYGRALIAGDGFPKDAVHGLELREASAKAEGDNCDMVYDLARDYDTGNGIAPNLERAMHWYREAMWTRGWNDEKATDAATRMCALMLAQKDGLRTYRNEFASLLAGFHSPLPQSEQKKLTLDIGKLLAPGEEVPTDPSTGAGLLLVNKSFGTPDYAKAIQYFTSSDYISPEDHPNTDPIALHQLGLIYELGLGVPRDHDRAMEFFEKGSDYYGTAFYFHALDYLHKWKEWQRSPASNPDGVNDDYDSEREAKKGAELGDVPSKRLYAEWIELHTELDQSLPAAEKPAEYRKANRLCQEASAAGDVQATYFLGTTAELGEGTPKDLAAAAKFYHQASDGGDTDAQERYAQMLILGQGGVPKDFAGGQTLLEKAGHSKSEAADEVAVFLWHGPDPKSHSAAIKTYLQKSFNDGCWIAGRNLAKYYHVGLGGKVDEAQARDYLEKAAKKGGKDSAEAAMKAYTKGDCVNINPAAAARWKAVAAGL